VTTEEHQVTITEKSTIRLTFPQAITIVGVLGSIVAAGSVAWYAEKSARQAHEANIHRHLDEGFDREHGQPVGKWDLVPRDEAAARAFQSFLDASARVDARQDRLEAEVAARKPRYRGP
jgi:hypothetical protein